MIRAYYIESKDDIIMTGPVTIRNGRPYFNGAMIPLKEVPRTRDRSTALLIDALGMRVRNMDDKAIRAKLPGSDIWYMTCIEREGDVFDGFLSNGDALLIPYHFLISDSVLTAAYELSDSCIPTLFLTKGEILKRKGTEGLRDVLRRLSQMKYERTVVFDTDGTLTADDWKELNYQYPQMIPYLNKDLQKLDGIDFPDIISDWPDLRQI